METELVKAELVEHVRKCIHRLGLTVDRVLKAKEEGRVLSQTEIYIGY